MIQKKLVRIFAFVLCLTVCLSMLPVEFSITASAKTYSGSEIQSVIDGIINWKKRGNGSTANGYLINNKFLEQAGSTPGDWFPIGLGRYGYKDNNRAYLAVIADKITQRYQTDDKLSNVKATEWHRISLAVLAMGGDPTSIGKDSSGNPINLIADGTYNRGKTVSLGEQGINGWIWGLITLDSMRYQIPSGAYYSRDDIIQAILGQQLADGGFSLNGDSADSDISAMALQALAPYYTSGKTYTYVQEATGSRVTKSVRKVVEETLAVLSKMQTNSGDYFSWGTQNVESADQVVVALCCLGINPETDQRFIKNGNTLIDGIMRYRMPDSGFVHSRTYDANNPSSLPNVSNSMASEQTLYTMVALYRLKNGMRTLYDFRPENSSNVSTPSVHASAFSASSSSANSHARGSSSSASSAKNNSSSSSTASKKAENTPLLFFSDTDKAAVDALPRKLSTEQYVTVLELLDKLEHCDDFEGKSKYKAILEKDKAQIMTNQSEINKLNQDIMNKLYPFDKLSLKDKAAVYDVIARYESLVPYDQKKILRYEDVIKAKTQIDNLERAVIITVVAAFAAICITVLVILRIRARRKKKQLLKMPADETDEEDEKS